LLQAEDDSFYQSQTRRVLSALVEVRRVENPSLAKIITDYVVSRQNADGGYTFCQGAESNAQDTYYGLSILSLLNADFPNLEKTFEFLDSIHLDSIYSIYYVAKTVLLLGRKIGQDIEERLHSILNSKTYYGSTAVFSEVSSEFTTTCMTLDLANLLEIKVDSKKVFKWLIHFRNEDGGFGPQGQSNINSTYYAIASIKFLNGDLRNYNEVATFVRACEKPHGGFTVIPMSLTPYMEHTYYGVMTLDLLGEECKYPAQTADFILKCQNKNGGFARSDLGISTFENTFEAVSMLHKLGLRL
jgi:hypothetical protein